MQDIKTNINTKILKLYRILDVIFAIIITLLFYVNIPIFTNNIVKIPQGSTHYIISYLTENGYQVTSFDAKLVYLIGRPQSGWVNIGKNQLTKYDFLHKICYSKAPMEDVTLIPGETLHFFFTEMATKLQVNYNKLKYHYTKLAPYPDGIIMPNTYKLPVGMKEEEIISRLLQDSMEFHKNLSLKIFGNFYQKEWFEYVTIASVIQKEAANVDEMPVVSSVIYNRLKNNMKLQMDGTLNYGKFSHTKVTPEMIKNDKTSYNTYMYNGIPEYPVCSVSFEAIKAAIFPSNTNYLYFVKNKSGTHTFSNSYKEHLDNIH